MSAWLRSQTTPEQRARLLAEHARTGGAGPTWRGAADEAQHVTARAWLLAGPAETGKTYAGLWRLDTEARRWPGSQWLIIRKVRATMDSTVLNTWRRIIAIRGGVAVFGGEHPAFYTYANGARVWVVGMDNPDKILSGEFDGAYYNQAEELDASDHETVTTRVTGRGAVTDTPMVWGDCNPGPADHWIQRMAQAGTMQLLESRHEDNPTLYDDAGRLTAQGARTMAVLDALTGVRYQRLRLGRWVGAEGQYFTAWDEDLHTCAPFPVPADWRVWGGFDYGYSHNTAFYLLTEHDGTVYVIGEHVANRWLVQQHVPAMAALCLRHGRTLAGLDIVAGHDVFAQKGDAEAKTIAQQYAAQGVVFRKAQIDRINRAQYLAERLGNPAAGTPPTLRVFTTCARLIATVPALPTDPQRPEDVKKIDADAEGHGGDDPYDAISYGLMEASRPPPSGWTATAVAGLARTSEV